MSGIGDQATYGAQRKGQSTLLRPDGPLVWLHFDTADDVPECAELVRKLQDGEVAPFVLVTTDDKTPVPDLRRKLPKGVVHQYLPEDEDAYIDRFFQFWKPDVCIWASDNLGFSVILKAAQNGIYLVYANAQPQKLSRFQRLLSNRYLTTIRRFDQISCLTRAGLERCVNHGVPASRVVVMPKIRSGGKAMPFDEAMRSQMASQMAGCPIWYTLNLDLSELDAVIDAQKQTARRAQRLLLLLQPKDMNAIDQFKNRLTDAGLLISSRSVDEYPPKGSQVFLLDVPDEEGLWLRVSPVTFVGGSLSDKDGFNPLNIAALGSAIVHGPNWGRHRVQFERLVSASATLQVATPKDLAMQLGDVISPDRAAELAHAAWLASSEGAETTDFLLDLVSETLAKEDAVAAGA